MVEKFCVIPEKQTCKQDEIRTVSSAFLDYTKGIARGKLEREESEGINEGREEERERENMNDFAVCVHVHLVCADEQILLLFYVRYREKRENLSHDL